MSNDPSYVPAGGTSKTYLRIMLWGSWKSGKTVFASTFPAPYFLHPASESGYDTFKDPRTGQSLFPYYQLGLTHQEFIAGMGGRSISEELNSQVAEIYARVKAGTCPYQTVVLGGFSVTCNNVWLEGVKRFPGERNTMKQWGYLSDWSKVFSEVLCSLPLHVIVEVNARTVKKSMTGWVEKVTPSLSGQTGEIYLNKSNVICFQEAREGLYQTHFSPVQRRDPNDRKSEVQEYAFATSRLAALKCYTSPVVNCSYDHLAGPLGLPPLTAVDPYHPRCQPGVWIWPHAHN